MRGQRSFIGCVVRDGGEWRNGCHSRRRGFASADISAGRWMRVTICRELWQRAHGEFVFRPGWIVLRRWRAGLNLGFFISRPAMARLAPMRQKKGKTATDQERGHCN